MKTIRRASRPVIVGSGVLLAALVLLGIVPWQLVAAEPNESKQPAAHDALSAVPLPAPRAPDALFQQGVWYEAEIKVIERNKNQPEHILLAPRMRYLAGNECVMVGALEKNKSQAIRVTASSTPEGKPMEHTVTATVFRDRTGKELTRDRLDKLANAAANVGGDEGPAVVSTSKITLVGDKTGGKLAGKITTTAADGLELEVATEISPVKAPGSSSPVSFDLWRSRLTLVGKNAIITYGICEFPSPQGTVKMELPAVGWTDATVPKRAR